MNRYFIEEAKCEVVEGDPFVSLVVAAVKFRDEEGKNSWLSLAEVGGLADFHLSDDDIYDCLTAEADENGEFADGVMETMDSTHIDEFKGLDVSDYEELFDSIAVQPDNPAVPLLRYMVALMRADNEETPKILAMAGHYADELDIPLSDLEEDYLAETREYDDEDQDDDNNDDNND